MAYKIPSQVIVIPENVHLENPLDLDDLLASIDRKEIIVHLERGARATVCDNRTTCLARSVQVVLGEGAHLQYRYDQRISQDEQKSSKLHFILMDHSSLYVTVTMIGGGKLGMDFDVQGEGATARVGGFYRLDHAQCAEIKTTQFHHKRFSSSMVWLHGIVADCARVDYNGLIVVQQEALHSTVEQFNKNILMGNDARARSEPSLEIKTNEVHCKHGTAVGRLDDEQLFYVQARGISADEAQKLLLTGFLAQSCAMMPEELRSMMQKNIDSLVW